MAGKRKAMPGLPGFEAVLLPPEEWPCIIEAPDGRHWLPGHAARGAAQPYATWRHWWWLAETRPGLTVAVFYNRAPAHNVIRLISCPNYQRIEDFGTVDAAMLTAPKIGEPLPPSTREELAEYGPCAEPRLRTAAVNAEELAEHDSRHAAALAERRVVGMSVAQAPALPALPPDVRLILRFDPDKDTVSVLDGVVVVTRRKE